GLLTVQWSSGGEVLVTTSPSRSNSTVPSGLNILKPIDLEMLPKLTPNGVNLVLHYTDADVANQAVAGGALRAFYFAAPLGRWVELPVTVDTAAHTVTVSNVDVSAFGLMPTTLALMGGPRRG